MLQGIFQAAAGMIARVNGQDVIANNLANAGTAGFQREFILARSRQKAVPTPAAGNRPAAQLLEAGSSADTRPGALENTGNKLDLALDGPGYLVAGTARDQRLTRGGTVRTDAQGVLVTSTGEPLLGVGGKPIQVGSGEWTVEADGTVTAGGATVGRLRIVRPNGPTQRQGASLLSVQGFTDMPVGGTRVLQGFREHSNVEPVREMVDMIAGMRAYETAQRAVVTQDQSLQSLLDVLRR